MHRLFKPLVPPAHLYARVLARVAVARRRRAAIELGVLGAFSFACTLGIVFAAQYAAAEFAASGFSSYLSLLISDTSFALTSREFLFSLIESLPSIALLMLLCLGGALLWSLAGVVRRARIALPSLAV